MRPSTFALPVLPAREDGTSPSQASANTIAPAADVLPGEANAVAAPTEPHFGRTYWRSIEEKLQGTASLPDADREFPAGAATPPTGFARREFMQLAAASVALAGLNACSEKPVEPILPYTKTPEGLTPGIPLHFATAHTEQGYGLGLLVTSWEGRPTKVEGNPEHPSSQGTTGLSEQALTLGLYDPQRARTLKENGAGRSWRALRERLFSLAAEWEKDGGARLRFLTEPSSSPLEAHLRDQIQRRFPKARFYSTASAFNDNAYEGARLALGQAVECIHSMEKADVVVSLDGDFLEPRPANLNDNRAFASRRSDVSNLNRLYVMESRLSITGGMADHRLRVKSSEVEGLALALLARVVANGKSAAGLSDLGSRGELKDEQQKKFVDAMAKDLVRTSGKSLVVTGPAQTPLTHAVVHALNAVLGNVGQTVSYVKPSVQDVAQGPKALKALVDEIHGGQVGALIITAWNPVFTAPADLDFASALQKVSHEGFSLYTGLYEDNTSELANWFVPAAHTLESWGDTRAKDGTVSIVQPLISPLFNGLTRADILAALVNTPETRVYDLLKGFHKTQDKSADFELAWETWLSKGVVPNTAISPQSMAVNFGAVSRAAASAQPVADQGYEVRFVTDYKVYDGRYANSTWLQEIPDPITKITWDNVAMLSPTTAKSLDVEQGDLIKLTKDGKELKAPVFIVPGHADGTITLPLGYGRKGLSEQVACSRGFNANVLRTADAPWFTTGVGVAKVGESFPLSPTQTHWSMEGRPIALMQTAAEFARAPEAEEQRRPLPSIQRAYDYTKEAYRWSLSVDLGRCTGCSACVIACQAENNIPVVGKEQVGKSREMHWMRIDRYFTDSETDPQMVTQPMMCQQCEAAPCEYVCPVNATVHSDEGLNDMVYNRCIGTRYCSNNCPYKVRHFNYLHWNADKPPMERMAMNPDVTVRARGVMEKCTYCVQRIERTRIVARIEGRAIRDTELKTACQQVCPTEALVFGNLADPESPVSKRAADARRYDVLHELNTRPRTTYLTRIKNPNPELA